MVKEPAEPFPVRPGPARGCRGMPVPARGLLRAHVAQTFRPGDRLTDALRRDRSMETRGFPLYEDIVEECAGAGLCAGGGLALFWACSSGSAEVVRADGKTWIRDRQGKSWNITHAVEQYGMEPAVAPRGHPRRHRGQALGGSLPTALRAAQQADRHPVASLRQSGPSRRAEIDQSVFSS